MFQVGETVVIGILGYVLRLGFHPAPILLGFVLGPRSRKISAAPC
jgi:TctA family transporter